MNTAVVVCTALAFLQVPWMVTGRDTALNRCTWAAFGWCLGLAFANLAGTR